MWGRTLVLLAAFAVLALAMVGPAQELCLNDGGHFAIEPRHVQCPGGGGVASAGSAATSAGMSIGVAAEPTGVQCSDVALSVDLQSVSGSRAKLPAPQPVQVCASIAQILDLVAAAPRVVSAPVMTPWRPPTLAHLRTVVIRC